jgi:8-oxo-dGTP pyrophosphatase MutT (NUDIX family)
MPEHEQEMPGLSAGIAGLIRAEAGGAGGDPVPVREAVPAATVILVRDSPAGGEAAHAGDRHLEVLLVHRDGRGPFGGMWVFPGGRVDPGDLGVDDGDEGIGAARRAAVREAQEEAGLLIPEGSLVPFSHWTPPPQSPRRFATWFFIAEAPVGAVTVDGGEIHDHRWISPLDALAERDAGRIELAPPTWTTLARLSGYPDVEAALQLSGASGPEVFVTRIEVVAGVPMALYEGDVGYLDGKADSAGPHHRLVMAERWSYHRPDGTSVLAFDPTDAVVPDEG